MSRFAMITEDTDYDVSEDGVPEFEPNPAAMDWTVKQLKDVAFKPQSDEEFSPYYGA